MADQTAQIIQQTGLVAIIRVKNADNLLAAADALREGGVCAIEVTITTPGALDIVAKAVEHFGPDVCFGAGTILDPETARAAILAGAKFLVCPTLNVRTIRMCRRYAIPIYPGAYTPTEILTAWEAGADMIKVFPADAGGPKYIKAVKAPLHQVKLMAVGGVDLNTTADFFRAGAEAVGVGSGLLNQKLLDQKDFKTITERARRYCEEVARGRADLKEE